jgi:hypothetical protein
MKSLRHWKRAAREYWQHFRSAPAGERFERQYREQREADKNRSPLARWVKPILAAIAFAIGVVLVFIPGPAVVFFAIAATCVASKSLTVARGLDRAEVWAREHWATLKKKFGRRNARFDARQN